MKPLRFLPLVALAAGSLLLLKLAALTLDGRSVLMGTQVVQARDAEKRTHGDKEGGDDPADVAKLETGDGGKKPAADANAPAPADGASAAAKSGDAAAQPTQDMESANETEHRTKSELALLESLAKRRETIEKRERELDLRVNLMKAAEQRVEEKIGVLKELQSKIETTTQRKAEERSEQYKRLVTLYSSMKPKDAARIFNELDNDILLSLMKEMKTQTMSAIFAAMDPTKTRALTIAIANESKQKVADKTADDELPRIGGR